MELYQAVGQYLAHLPTVQAWPEMNQFLQKIIAKKPTHWRLAARACQAVGGTLEDAIPAVAAMGALFLSIVLVDDMLDHDPKGQHLLYGEGATANMASALQAMGYEAIAASPLTPTRQSLIVRRLNQMMLKTTVGQYWDSQNPSDEESYWRVAHTKSSPYFSTSLFVGAVMGGADEDTAERLAALGAVYGEMIQVNDDLNDVMEVPANVDWAEGRYPLPILFAASVNHPQQARFLALRSQVHDEASLLEAQEILIRCGAMSYGVEQLSQRYQKAIHILEKTPLADPTPINQLVEKLFAPINRLMEGVPQGNA